MASSTSEQTTRCNKTSVEQRSVLDTVLADAKSTSRKLSESDNHKLDEYFQSVREIEVRIGKEEKWLNVEKQQPKNPIQEPEESLQGYEEIRIV